MVREYGATVRVINTPDKTEVWDDTAEEVVLQPSTTGQSLCPSGHVPLLTALDTGVMRLPARLGDTAVKGDSLSNNEVNVLVNVR